MSSETPDPSWSAEKMTRYMEEKYGKERFVDGRTRQPVPWRRITELFDGDHSRDPARRRGR